MSTQLTTRPTDDSQYVDFVVEVIDLRRVRHCLTWQAVCRDCRWFAGEVSYCWGLYVSILRSVVGRWSTYGVLPMPEHDDEKLTVDLASQVQPSPAKSAAELLADYFTEFPPIHYGIICRDSLDL